MLYLLDSRGFNGFFFRVRLFLKLESLFRPNNTNFRITSYYKQNEFNALSQLCDLYGSDKGEAGKGSKPYPWNSHSYTDYYWHAFSNSRNLVKNVLEVGIGTTNPSFPSSMSANGMPGASLRVWRDFFPNALVYGADIDREILFEETRIKTAYMDQLNSESISDFFKNIGVFDFDLMIDDGLHSFEAGSILFTNAIERLSKTGTYIIEDVALADLERYKDFFDNLPHDVHFINLYRPGLDLLDNSLIVVKHY